MMVIVPGAAEAADQTLQLDVQINGYPVGKIGEFVLRDGALLARRDELTDVGIRVPDSVAAGADGLIAISDLSGLSWRIDQDTQTLHVVARDDSLLPALLKVGGMGRGDAAIESGTGATLDYDITQSSAAGRPSTSALFEARAFSPWGVVSSSALGYVGMSPRGPDTNAAIRLDSTYTYSDPVALRRYRLGDFINGSLAWTRPIRMGGAQITSDFSLRPDLVTFPLPSVSGSVAVPSTLDVLVNGERLLSRQVGAGPFEIPQLPVVTGAGTVTMAVNNALGRQVITTLPFYASSALLAEGLQTYSGQVGMVRRNWGTLSNDYGPAAATATWRRGWSSMLTLEGSGEATRGTTMAGAGAVINIDNLAVLNVSVAGSAGAGAHGAQLAAGIQRLGTAFSFGVSAIMASPAFRDVAAANGDPVSRLQINASGGLSMGRYGSLGIAYAEVRRYANDVAVALPDTIDYLTPLQSARVFTASYSVQVRNVSFYATGFHGFGQQASNGILVGLTVPLGRRDSVGISFGSGSGGASRQVTAQQSPVTVGDWGYQAYATSGAPDHEFLQAGYKSPWALVTAGVDRIGRQSSLAAEAQGSISFVDRAVFASNTIADSFAVVDTNRMAGVRVLIENREVGVTNAAGKLLVPELRSFDVNHLAIDPTDIPQDTTIDVTERVVRPQDRSGVVVRFPVTVSHGALVRLIDAADAPMPVGSTAMLQATGDIVPVGYDGEAYLQNLERHNRVLVERLDGTRCTVEFEYRPVPGRIPTIGPLRCVGPGP
jgi:outer membrane usher protein